MKVIKIAVILLVAILISGGFAYYKMTTDAKIAKYEEAIQSADSQINDLQTQMNYTGELTTVYELTTDVHGGTQISESDLKPVQLPKAMSTNCPQSVDDFIGKYYLFNIKQGQILSYNQMMDFEVDDNMRELDIPLDSTPIGLQVGDYVDINISFTLGQNFIGITHKRVMAINDNVIKIVVDPKDVYVYESMKVDRAIYTGTTIKAVKYIEGTAQLAGKDYYPIRIEAMTTLLQDPNVTMDFSSLSTSDRELLESQLNSSNEATKEIMKEVSKAKEKLDSAYKSAKNQFDRAMEEQMKEAQRKAEKEAESAE